ncbi:MAG: NAD-binding protein [Labilithrix sp.]|nr:NAD-binding protein [Labilithrix sp.]
MVDRIVVVGAGRTSGSILGRLTRHAPVTVVDVSPSAIDAIHEHGSTTDDARPLLVRRVADGTSRLVLEDLRGDPKSRVALIAATGDDRAALEITRLGRELAYAPIVAIVNDAEIARQCEALEARALVRAQLVARLVEQSLHQGGTAMTSSLGFGLGELLEFRVLPSSPAIGVPLANLRADGWRVAAIYRGTELVLPTGTTTIAAEDRVLIIGDPRQLPHVAESLRVGLPSFPLLHGPNVVVYLPAGREPAIEEEAELLTSNTRAARLVRVYPGASGARHMVDSARPDGGSERRHFEDAPLAGELLERHLDTLRDRQPGVVVTRARRRGVGDVLLGRGGREAALCNALRAPVLFPNGAPRYERIVVGVTEGAADLEAAEVGLDLARMFSIPFSVMRVKLPSYLESASPEVDKLVTTIEHRARLHGVSVERVELEGNPIAVWSRSSLPTDLCVVSRHETIRDSFSQPDLALRLARSAKGSVLVVTVHP